MCNSAVGVFIPRVSKAFNEQALVTCSYSLTFQNRSQSKACILVPRVVSSHKPSPRYYTTITKQKSRDTGVRYTCTCKRHLHGLLCDHVYKHVTATSKFKLREIVHRRYLMGFYKSQYLQGKLDNYVIPTVTNLELDSGLFLPTCCLPKRGRPKKRRFIGYREQAVNRAKKRIHKRMTSASTINLRVRQGGKNGDSKNKGHSSSIKSSRSRAKTKWNLRKNI